MSNPTKYYSSRQEKLVADKLGWDTVVASGARNFHPGDVKSSKWLGECKTHTKESDNVVIKLSVWDKICQEASSEFKYPVLFVDNGTQTLLGTWAVFNYSAYSADNSYLVVSDSECSDISRYVRTTKSSIIFNHVDMMHLYQKLNKLKISSDMNCSVIIHLGKFGSTCVGMCPLQEFCYMFSNKEE